MPQLLKTISIVIIACGLLIGVRYIGAVLHYACANPAEDCPPPFNAAGQLAFYITGGELMPLFRR